MGRKNARFPQVEGRSAKILWRRDVDGMASGGQLVERQQPPKPGWALGYPPRVDTPLETRIAWYREALAAMGHPTLDDVCDELTLRFLQLDYEEAGGPQRKLWDWFSPTIRVPDPRTVPAHRLDAELEGVVERLEAHRILVEVCDHLTSEQVLGALRQDLDTRCGPPPEQGFVHIWLHDLCPECIRELLEAEGLAVAPPACA